MSTQCNADAKKCKNEIPDWKRQNQDKIQNWKRNPGQTKDKPRTKSQTGKHFQDTFSRLGIFPGSVSRPRKHFQDAFPDLEIFPGSLPRLENIARMISQTGKHFQDKPRATPSWICPGFILEMSWKLILEMRSWIHPGRGLGLRVENFPGSVWKRPGNAWICPGFVLDSSWIVPGKFSRINPDSTRWKFPGHFPDKPRMFPGHFPGHFPGQNFPC